MLGLPLFDATRRGHVPLRSNSKLLTSERAAAKAKLQQQTTAAASQPQESPAAPLSSVVPVQKVELAADETKPAWATKLEGLCERVLETQSAQPAQVEKGKPAGHTKAPKLMLRTLSPEKEDQHIDPVVTP